MTTEKEKWLNSRDQGRWAVANRFDAKALRTFYCLEVNSKLETIIADKKFKASGITDMGQLLLAIAKIPSRAAYIAVGAQTITPTERDALDRICDPHYTKRDELRGQITTMREELNRERSRSLGNPSYEDIESQNRTVKLLNSKLYELEKEFAAIPNRNTLPADLTAFPSREDLTEKDFVTMKHPKAPKLKGSRTSTIPFLTEKGKRLYDASVKLAYEIDFLLKTGSQINASLIQQLHKQAQEAYRECLQD